MQISVMSVFLVALVFAAAVSAGAAPVKIEKVPYFNQPNCYKLSNGSVEVIATSTSAPGSSPIDSSELRTSWAR